jgi:hypothetical protein
MATAVAEFQPLHFDVAEDRWDEDGVSETFLQQVCETDDLLSVTRLEIQVDSVVQSVECLGDHLPNLRQLKLTDSNILCIRDIGTALMQLEVLWMSRCGLQDLNGISAIPVLREFYLPFNDVADLSPLSTHDTLEVLDVEGNEVDNLDEVVALKLCVSLRELTLTGNPVCKGDTFSRQAVLELLPQLSVLDDISTDSVLQTETPSGGPDECEPDEEPDLDFGADDKGSNLLSDYGSDISDVDSEMYRHVEKDPECDLEEVRESSYRIEGGLPTDSSSHCHPLLTQGSTSTTSECTASASDSRYAGEPNEQELIVENIKRLRPRLATNCMAQTFSARPSTATSSSSLFNFRQIPERRESHTAHGNSFRLDFEDMKIHAVDAASDMTCGIPLAGNLVSAVRQRRCQSASSVPNQDSDMDIRGLLKRYQTFIQPSCIPVEELRNRKRESDSRRPGTPDVRIHVPDRRLSRDTGRPASTWGGRVIKRASTARPSPPSPDACDEVSSNVLQPTLHFCNGEVLLLDEEEPEELQ